MADDSGKRRPLASPSAATLAAAQDAQRRNALYAPGPLPDLLQVWVERDTGRRVRLLGRRSTTWVARSLEDDTVLDIGLDEHARRYRYLSSDCAHDRYCCTTHGVHADPHRHCVLR